MLALRPEKIWTISWKAYLVRFGLGGLVTLIAGMIGKLYGPVVGGLFLAFPSIAIASLTLIERDKGKNAVGADAAGAGLGSLGLRPLARSSGCLPPTYQRGCCSAQPGSSGSCSQASSG